MFKILQKIAFSTYYTIYVFCFCVLCIFPFNQYISLFLFYPKIKNLNNSLTEVIHHLIFLLFKSHVAYSDIHLFTLLPIFLTGSFMFYSEITVWKLEYNARTSAERCNKREKIDYKLEDGRYRSSMMWYCRLFAIMMCQHLDAWTLPKTSQLKELFEQVA